MKIINKALAKLFVKFIGRNDKKQYQNLLKLRSNYPLYKFDINYLDDNKKEHLFDFYNTNSNISIIDVHGGGYVYSYKENNFQVNNYLANKGFNIIATNYTLFDGKIDIRYIIKELASLINYLYKNNDVYKIDFNNLILKGDSAGGHIIFLLALAITNKNMANYYKIDVPKDVKIKKIILNSPVYDYNLLFFSGKKFFFKSALKYFFGTASDNNLINNNDPSYLIRNNLVDINFDIFVSTSNFDFLKDHSLKLKSELFNKVYLDFTFTNNKNINHIHNVLHTNLKEGIKTNNKIVDFINNDLK